MKLIGLQYTKYVLFQISDSGSFEIIFDRIKIKHKENISFIVEFFR